MKNKLKYIFFVFVLMVVVINFMVCLLDEVNLGEFIMDFLVEIEEIYEKIINNCYFVMECYFYGVSGVSGIESNNWMVMIEVIMDLWIYQCNKLILYIQWFWFYVGVLFNIIYIDNFWSGIYDGIGVCNIVILKVDKVLFKIEEVCNVKVVEVYFLCVVYYFNVVE